jgi:hypothetical protein
MYVATPSRIASQESLHPLRLFPPAVADGVAELDQSAQAVEPQDTVSTTVVVAPEPEPPTVDVTTRVTVEVPPPPPTVTVLVPQGPCEVTTEVTVWAGPG